MIDGHTGDTAIADRPAEFHGRPAADGVDPATAPVAPALGGSTDGLTHLLKPEASQGPDSLADAVGAVGGCRRHRSDMPWRRRTLPGPRATSICDGRATADSPTDAGPESAPP